MLINAGLATVNTKGYSKQVLARLKIQKLYTKKLRVDFLRIIMGLNSKL